MQTRVILSASTRIVNETSEAELGEKVGWRWKQVDVALWWREGTRLGRGRGEETPHSLAEGRSKGERSIESGARAPNCESVFQKDDSRVKLKNLYHLKS